MTLTHELGHIIGGFCCGGQLLSADLRPWSLPYSYFDPDPVPLVTLWSGPIIGVLAPVLVAVLINRDWAWFVANFCVLANGAYLALAWISGDNHLDTNRLLNHGAHPLTIALFCLITLSSGYVRFRRSCIRVFNGRPSTHRSADRSQ